jgi:raffinose/stachyose/melibiose transport system permease protein
VGRLRLSPSTRTPWRRLSATGARSGRNARAIRHVPWLVALPGVAFLFGFHLIPMVAGGWYAFTDWNGVAAAADFVGLENFRAILEDEQSRAALLQTLQLAAGFIVLVNLIGLALALALNRTVKSRHLLRSAFFLPVVISPLAVAYIFQYILDFRGPVNQLLTTVGLDEWTRPWLGDPSTALWCVLLVLVWQHAGLCMVIYLAGLQGVSDDVVEAAAVDGASPWLQFRKVTLPLLAPAMTINVTLMMIIGMKTFDQVVALTGGGPFHATETLATQVWEQTWLNGRFGYGAALALVLTVLVAVAAISQSLFLRRRELTA